MNDTLIDQSHTTPTRAHPTDVAQPRGVRIVHLVFGILFLGIAAIWALSDTDLIRVDVSVAFALPLILILAGVAGLAAMLVNGARARRTTDPRD